MSSRFDIINLEAIHMPENLLILSIIISAFPIFEGLRRISNVFFGLIEWISSRNWPSAEGKIIRSEVQLVFVPKYRRGARVLPDVTRYLPDIVYEYFVSDQTYQSKKIYVGRSYLLSDIRSAESVVKHFPLNSSVTVFYNPNKPEISALYTKIYKYDLGYLISGLIFLFIGLGMLIFAINK